jgi:Tfp pilus assembly protein PilN
MSLITFHKTPGNIDRLTKAPSNKTEEEQREQIIRGRRQNRHEMDFILTSMLSCI